MDSYYNLTGTQFTSEQNLFVVPLLEIFGVKLPVHLLCTIINISPDVVILPKNGHIGEMTPLNCSDISVHTPYINKVTHDISPDSVNYLFVLVGHN